MSPTPSSSSDRVRIGSRGSALARVQARWVAERLAERGIPSEIVLIRTAGDDRGPDTTWGEGAFVSAIEAALLEGRIDAAVHSAKDVPTEEDPRLTIAAWTVREDPHDALVCRVRGTTLATLPPHASVGTDSPRRGACLRAVRPDLTIHPLSGNVDTRLRKLDDGESDALVLAVAGLTRLGRADRIDEILPFELAIPAPGQGTLALQARADDARTIQALAALDHRDSRIAVEAERAFLASTGGGCRSPIGAIGTVKGKRLTLRVAAEREGSPGHRTGGAGSIVRLVATGPSEDGVGLARELAERIVQFRTRARVPVTTTTHPLASHVVAVEPAHRLRRTRRSEALRSFVRETRIHPRNLVAPLFVQPGHDRREAISSMPGVDRVSPDLAVEDARRLAALGVGAVILFGLPTGKDPLGTGAWLDDGIVQETLRRLRDADVDLVLIADTCLCEYTDHGHCGPLTPDGSVDNDAAVERLAATAVSQATAGADVVAPSAMMDGQVLAIRQALDRSGAPGTAILAYAAKTASAFYGPFREAADSAPAFGDRRGYQMDPANGREALREMDADIAQGADMLLVKPALPSLDILAAARARFDVPIGAYQVSGEFSMIEAAAANGWIDRKRALLEATTSILRAGAGFVITYAAADLATWITETTG